MSLLFSTQDEGGGSFTEQLAFKSYHFLDTIVVFKPRFLLRTHAKGPSMSFYPDFILILSWFYPDFIQILSR